MTGEISRNHTGLAEHAGEIRLLGQRIVTDLVEIGRRLVEAKDLAGHGRFGRWLSEEFGWSTSTALNYMRTFELARSNPQRFANLNSLPISSIYLLSAPGTPPKAVTEILDRAEAGELLSGVDVRIAISRAKGEKDGEYVVDDDADDEEDAENGIVARTDGVAGDAAASGDAAMPGGAAPSAVPDEAHTPGDTAVPGGAAPSAVPDEAPTRAADPPARSDDQALPDVGSDDQASPAGPDDQASPAGPDQPLSEPKLAPDPVATAVAAVNRLTPIELQEFLDRLWPVSKRAFELKFGARDKINAEIVAQVGECSALLTHPGQNTDAIRRKLERIKALAGGDKARASNVKLDRGAFERAIGTAGAGDKKSPIINMAPDSADGVWK